MIFIIRVFYRQEIARRLRKNLVSTGSVDITSSKMQIVLHMTEGKIVTNIIKT